jgi:hypothetical protein
VFRQKPLKILGGMLVAVAVGVFVAFFVGWGSPDPLPQNVAERLAFAARWLLLPGLALFVGIGLTANRRFLSPDAIDGQKPIENNSFEINLRYNQNTLEQVVLAAIAWIGLALVLPAEQLGIIPRIAILFAVGRATFWIGYLYAPWARAFGMGLTAYPTFAVLIFLAWKAMQ